MCLQSMVDSKVVEISSDQLRLRKRDKPEKWPLDSSASEPFVDSSSAPVMPTSNLNVDVPEFVPGQLYRFSSQVTGQFSSVREQL